MTTDPILPRMSSDTQPDPVRRGLILRSPVVLALIVTAANGVKPVMIDDTAYLAYARHIAANPLDPYGFRVFWYDVPQPAMEVLAPPVVPYWLALGINLFGETPVILKLWLFPFVWLFAWAVRDLLQRFARGTETRLLPMLMLSPAVLPTVNLMLDVPALALGLTAVVLFTRAADRRSWRLAVVAGLVAALAMQTKYTMLLIPPVIGWYGLMHRRVGWATASVLTATTGFIGWELCLVAEYGQSHFVYHAGSRQHAGMTVALAEKVALAPALVGHLGCLGIGVGLVAGFALGVSRRVLGVLGGVWAFGVTLVVLLPYRWTVLVPAAPPDKPATTAVMVFWQLSGVLVLAGFVGCGFLLGWRPGKRIRLRTNPDLLFLLGWLLIELAGYFVLTPFGAARRVIGLVVVGGLLAGRALSRVERLRPGYPLPGWVPLLGIVAGVLVAVIDTLDAFPEQVLAERAAFVAAELAPGVTIWYAGHWGFQFYCERAGMRAVVPGESILKPGDVLVLPLLPEPHGFYRPDLEYNAQPPAGVVDELAGLVWDDPVSGQTVPNFYCGMDPITGRDHPRLRVAVYRLRGQWSVPRWP